MVSENGAVSGTFLVLIDCLRADNNCFNSAVFFAAVKAGSVPALTTIAPAFAFLGAGAEAEADPEAEDEEEEEISDAGLFLSTFACSSFLVSSLTYHSQKASFSITSAIMKVNESSKS